MKILGKVQEVSHYELDSTERPRIRRPVAEGGVSRHPPRSRQSAKLEPKLGLVGDDPLGQILLARKMV